MSLVLSGNHDSGEVLCCLDRWLKFELYINNKNYD